MQGGEAVCVVSAGSNKGARRRAERPDRGEKEDRRIFRDVRSVRVGWPHKDETAGKHANAGQKSRGQFVGHCFGSFIEMSLDGAGVKVQPSGLTLCDVLRAEKNKALNWPHCIQSRCLAILRTFYAAAGENYSTGSRDEGFERTGQI